MKKQLLFIFLILTFNSLAQDSVRIKEKKFFIVRREFLLSQLEKSNINIDELNELIEYTLKEDLEKGKAMINHNIIKANNLQLYGNLKLRYADYYFQKGKMDSCRYFLDKTIQIAKKNNLKKLYVNTLIESSKYFITKSERNKASDSINKALSFIKKNKLNFNKIKIEKAKIQILTLADSISKSLDNSLLVLEKINKDKTINPINKLDLYFFLSQNYGKMNDLKSQKKYIDLYFSYAKKTAYPFLYTIYNQKANYHFLKGELNEALKTINYGYRIAKKAKNTYRVYLLNSNKGTILMYLDRLPEAEKILLKSLKYEKEQGLLENSANSLEDLSRINYFLGKKEKSRYYFKRAIDSAKKITNNHLYLASFFENKYIDFKETKNFKESLFYLEKYQIEATAMFEEKFYIKAAELEVKFETQQKENQILKLTNETQEKEISLQKSKAKTNYALASIFLLVLGGGLFIRKRKKDQKLKLLETAIKSTEEEKVRIGRELHDGIASDLRTLAHNIETENINLSHKLLNTYNQIRGVSHQLNNTPMHDDGELFMDRVFEIVPENTENQVFELKINPPYLELTEPYSTHLFRITQELFTNSLKYAKASKTRIHIIVKNNFLTLNYTDNGVGATKIKKGKGLKSIEDRVTLLNGTLNITTENGFVLTAKIPYKK